MTRAALRPSPPWCLDILSLGMWTPGLSPRPETTLLPAAERRRAPLTVLMALAAAEQACAQAGLDPATLPSVFTSAHGDMDITDYLCRTLAESPEHLSPTKFHHSVHNAASGYWTMGTGCMQASTALSAGDSSFAQGLLEAASQAVCAGQPVLLVAYDMVATGTLSCITGPGLASEAMSLALVLAPATTEPLRNTASGLARVELSLEAAPAGHQPFCAPATSLLSVLSDTPPSAQPVLRWSLGPQLGLRLAFFPTTSSNTH